MKTIKQSYSIKAPIDEVWRALVDPKDIAAWGGGPAKMDDKVGTKFSLWGGDIYGKNIKVEKNELLVQEWYGGKWNRPSIATFALTQKGKVTKVVLKHEGVPKNDYKNIDQGWKDYYLNPIKEYLEGGDK